MAAGGPGASVFKPRNWRHRRDLWFLIVVGAVLAGYHGYVYATSFGRMTDRLQARLAQHPERLNIAITTPFAPEAFHMGIYQRYGSMRGTTGNTAILFRVRISDVTRLSRRYWVEKIDLAPAKR